MNLYRSLLRLATSKLDRDMMLAALEINSSSPTAIRDALLLISELRSHQRYGADGLHGPTDSAGGTHDSPTPPP
jgi:hypothetical protein